MSSEVKSMSCLGYKSSFPHTARRNTHHSIHRHGNGGTPSAVAFMHVEGPVPVREAVHSEMPKGNCDELPGEAGEAPDLLPLVCELQLRLLEEWAALMGASCKEEFLFLFIYSVIVCLIDFGGLLKMCLGPYTSWPHPVTDSSMSACQVACS